MFNVTITDRLRATCSAPVDPTVTPPPRCGRPAVAYMSAAPEGWGTVLARVCIDHLFEAKRAGGFQWSRPPVDAERVVDEYVVEYRGYTLDREGDGTHWLVFEAAGPATGDLPGRYADLRDAESAVDDYLDDRYTLAPLVPGPAGSAGWELFCRCGCGRLLRSRTHDGLDALVASHDHPRGGGL